MNTTHPHDENRFAVEVAAVIASYDEAAGGTTLPDEADLNVPCRHCGQISDGGNWRFPDGTAECDEHYFHLSGEHEPQ